MSELIEQFKSFFIGRKNAYGLYTNGGITVIKQKLTDDLLKQHLNKKITIGAYYAYKTVDNWYCKYVCIDFDNHDVDDVKEIKKLWNLKTLEIKNALIERYDIDLNCIAREFSGRGYHIWIKLKQKTTLKRAFDFREDIRFFLLKEFDIDEEIFPKQSELNSDQYGNWIKLPLSINRKNGEYCKILDDFNLEEQGEGYNIPLWIPRCKEMSKNSRNNNKLELQEIELQENNECLDWFLEHMRPCLKRIALDNSLTHNTKKGVGHSMNLTLCDTLLYLGASDRIIHKIFRKHPNYDPNKTQSNIDGCRKSLKKTHVLITCDKIKLRGFCIDCDR